VQRFRGVITDSKGAPVSGVTVEVRLAGLATVATIYSDDGVTTRANPFTNDANGSFEFFAANGRYDLIPTKAGLTFDNADFTDIRLVDTPIKVNTTAAGTPASTVETDLITVTLPVRTLNWNGQALRVRAWGTTAANANLKTARLYFGTAVLVTTGALAANAKDWVLEALVTRIGDTTQDAIAQGIFNGALVDAKFTAPNQTLTAAVIVKVTGENGTAAANDLVAEGLIVTEA
jgi:hypothetical protein